MWLNANRITYQVIGAGTVTLSPSHILLVPSLSNKLQTVSQAIVDLNFMIFINTTFCHIQAILTNKIIERGIKMMHNTT